MFCTALWGFHLCILNTPLHSKPAQMADVATFCNAFPNVEMAFEVQDSDDITAGDPVSLVVTLEREGEEDEDEPEEGWGKVSCSKLSYCCSVIVQYHIVVGCLGGVCSCSSTKRGMSFFFFFFASCAQDTDAVCVP